MSFQVFILYKQAQNPRKKCKTKFKSIVRTDGLVKWVCISMWTEGRCISFHYIWSPKMYVAGDGHRVGSPLWSSQRISRYNKGSRTKKTYIFSESICFWNETGLKRMILQYKILVVQEKFLVDNISRNNEKVLADTLQNSENVFVYSCVLENFLH